MNQTFTVLPKVHDDSQTLRTRSAFLFWFGISALAWSALLVLLV